MNDILMALKDVCVSALTGAFVFIITKFYAMAQQFITAKIDSVKAATTDARKAAIMDALQKICKDVSAAFDPVAEELKKSHEDGKLTEAEKDQIKEDAKNAAMLALTGVFSMETINAAGIDKNTIIEMVTAAVEASLQRRKKGQEKE